MGRPDSARPRSIGDRVVWPIGLGGARWSLDPDVDEARAVRTIHAALDAGVTLLDTARAYTTVDHHAHNETLIARALAERSDADRVLVVTKGGHVRIDATTWGVDGTPTALRRDCEASLRALGVEAIGLYLLHHPDPTVPVEESVGALHDLQVEGLVTMIGVSNVDLEQLARARRVAPLAAVENQFSPVDQHDRPVVDVCREVGIAYLAYSPLGGRDPAVGSGAPSLPRSRALAREAGLSVPRLLLAWMVHRRGVIPVVGSTRPESAADSAAAASVVLTDDEWSVLDEEIADL